MKDLVFSNFKPSVIEKIKNNTIKDDDSVAKLLIVDKTDNGIKMNIFLVLHYQVLLLPMLLVVLCGFICFRRRLCIGIV